VRRVTTCRIHYDEDMYHLAEGILAYLRDGWCICTTFLADIRPQRQTRRQAASTNPLKILQKKGHSLRAARKPISPSVRGLPQCSRHGKEGIHRAQIAPAPARLVRHTPNAPAIRAGTHRIRAPWPRSEFGRRHRSPGEEESFRTDCLARASCRLGNAFEGAYFERSTLRGYSRYIRRHQSHRERRS
jgi:hypothetical protein